MSVALQVELDECTGCDACRNKQAFVEERLLKIQEAQPWRKWAHLWSYGWLIRPHVSIPGRRDEVGPGSCPADNRELTSAVLEDLKEMLGVECVEIA